MLVKITDIKENNIFEIKFMRKEIFEKIKVPCIVIQLKFCFLFFFNE
jgi:hypothetical protein